MRRTHPHPPRPPLESGSVTAATISCSTLHTATVTSDAVLQVSVMACVTITPAYHRTVLALSSALLLTSTPHHPLL